MVAISENVKAEVMPQENTRMRPLVIGLLLTLLCAAVYGPILSAGFVRWDDDIHVYNNPYLTPVTLAHVRHFWILPYQNLYIPVSYTLYALLALGARLPTPMLLSDGLLTQLDPRVFHAASLLLHIGCTLLVLGLLRRLIKNDWAAAAGAALFAVHPVQVESVAWVSEMRGLLSAFFALLALRLHVGNDAKRYDALATLCFALALLSKPSAATLPLVGWAIDALLLRRNWTNGLKIVTAWGVLSVAALVVTHGAQPVNLESVTPLWTRPIIAGDALAFYLGKLIAPAHLGIDYGRTPGWVVGHPWVWTEMLVLAALAIILWRLRRPALTAAALVLVAGLLPTLGLTPFTYQIFSTVADRYLYLAMLGPALALAWYLSRANRMTWAAASVALLLCAVLSMAQVRVWSNSITLFSHAVLANPRSWAGHNNLGTVLMNLGNNAEAETQFETALAIRPNYPEAHDNLGASLYNQGHPEAASREFQAALRLKPDYPNAHAGLGMALLALGRPREAMGELQIALRQQPDFPAAQKCLTLAMKAMQKT